MRKLRKKKKENRNRIVSESNTDLTLSKTECVDLRNRFGLSRFQPGQG